MDILISKDYLGNYLAVNSDNYCGCIDCQDNIGFGETELDAKINLYETVFNIKVYSFKEIKEEYTNEYVPYFTFEEFLKNKFTPIYDKNLDFIGYEKDIK